MSTLLNRPTTKFLDSRGYVSHEWNIWLTNPNFNSISATNINIGSTVIGIANGGTGQSSPSAAFNALSPITNAGDLIIGNGISSATRLVIGVSGSVLTSDGTTASWQPLPTSTVSRAYVYAARHG
jgi:hypothetical protein